MMINDQPDISDYWDTRKITPTHDFMNSMSKNRYLELHMRFQCHGLDIKGLFARFLYNYDSSKSNI
jgi:hypothetical protein